MDPLIRTLVLVGSIPVVVVLIYLNKYAVENYWLPAVRDGEEETDEEYPVDDV